MAGDCDDDDEDVFPGGIELPDNGIDDDCDGDVDESIDDLDGDGVSVVDGDCDDENGWMAPGMLEMCDGIDNNCDGVIDEGCDASVGGADAPAAGEKGGCSTAGARSAGLVWVLSACALMFRRRGRPRRGGE